jgi:gliding motility-associated-like protein
MKKQIFAALLFLSLYRLSAQITITSADMPNTGDNILISVNNSLANFHKDSTGANYLWDYSNLIPDSQRYVNFVSPLTTPYAFGFFSSSYGTRNYTPDQLPWSLIGTPPTNGYDFYKKSNANYKITGSGITESGLPIPETYTPGDIVYKFPLNYLQKDSSSSQFGFAIPNQGYYGKKQKRVNEVDGWGTLITPYGTFSTLRIKSTLTITDSIYLDTVHFGFNIPRPIAYEFKWLANGMKIPLLEIDANAAGDSIMVAPSVSFNTQNSCPIVNEGSITANPNGARYPLTYSWSNGATTPTINNLAPGTYTITIKDRYGRVVTAVDTVKTLSDSSCMILITFAGEKTCPMAKDGSLSATITGARNPSTYLWSTGDTATTFIKNLAPGSYDFQVTDKYGRIGFATGTVEGYTQDLKCLNIPSAFTPDGDGVNDVWRIRSLSEYTDCKVEIFNQWGSLVFKSTGYATPWDGKYNGEAVPAGAYYYVIDLSNGSNKYTGTVTIVK